VVVLVVHGISAADWQSQQWKGMAIILANDEWRLLNCEFFKLQKWEEQMGEHRLWSRCASLVCWSYSFRGKLTGNEVERLQSSLEELLSGLHMLFR
tara:strand:+ start:300 stop:587 length:288 start_codon:yes stop_codon:yes gene_type:complete